jgi:uncharacterized protein YqgC (DUF456 family)
MQIGPYFIEIEQVARGVALVLMAVGLLVTPILPGPVIIWVAALGYGIASGFSVLGWVMFGLITILMVGASVVDNILMGTRTHREGTPWWVILLALLAAIIGSIAIPVPVIGGIACALAVLFLVEWLRRKDVSKALAALRGMLAGWGWAAILRVIIGLVMVGLWLIWAWT